MTSFEKFQKLLEELFQLDQADLDFGIYRIMNQKRDEIVRFLENDLLPQVKDPFQQYKSADKAGIQKDLDRAVEQAEGLGVDPETTAKVRDLRAKYENSSVDVATLESEVFSHLYSFFRRYYHEGDFISQRRYKEGVYAIPYEGEEVKLHWANHDQYYVKSSEYFRDYIFTVPSGKRVRVHLVAASSEQDNKKEAPGKERRFIICEENPVYPEIAANDAQCEEWVRLFAIDEIEKDLNGPGYSQPLTVDFLESNTNLVVDTCFFPQVFQDSLLKTIDRLDEDCAGFLVNSDNFHALSLLHRRFRRCVSCIYIDPPYNTGSDGFIYKDSYQHSSWLSCLHDRLTLASPMMDDLGSLFMSIDDHEQVRLRELTDSLLGDDNFIATVIWQKVYSPKNSARHFSEDHAFLLVYARRATQWTPSLLPQTAEANARYQNFDDDPRGPWKSSDLTARNYYSKGRYEVVGPTGKTFTSGVGRYWRQSEGVFWQMEEDNRIWGGA